MKSKAKQNKTTGIEKKMSVFFVSIHSFIHLFIFTANICIFEMDFRKTKYMEKKPFTMRTGSGSSFKVLLDIIIIIATTHPSARLRSAPTLPATSPARGEQEKGAGVESHVVPGLFDSGVSGGGDFKRLA